MGENYCSVDDCEHRIRAKSLCAKHYRRLKFYGSVEAGKYLSSGEAEDRLRFVGWIVTESGCWEWKGSRRGPGYGRISVCGKVVPTHRLAYETWVGPIPEGHLVRHKCDNPPCINPSHLETGTHRDNARDRETRTRSSAGSGNPRAKLTEKDVLDIREEYAKGVLTQQMLAEVYGVKAHAVYKAIHGLSWKEV